MLTIHFFKKSNLFLLIAIGLNFLSIRALAMSYGSALNPGQTMMVADKLVSQNKRFEFFLHENGNLILTDNNNPIWTSGTSGSHATHFMMQMDGNAVLYQDHVKLWETGTHFNNYGTHLLLQNDGNLVMYHPVWASNTPRKLRVCCLTGQTCTIEEIYF